MCLFFQQKSTVYVVGEEVIRIGYKEERIWSYRLICEKHGTIFTSLGGASLSRCVMIEVTGFSISYCLTTNETGRSCILISLNLSQMRIVFFLCQEIIAHDHKKRCLLNSIILCLVGVVLHMQDNLLISLLIFVSYICSVEIHITCVSRADLTRCHLR